MQCFLPDACSGWPVRNSSRYKLDTANFQSCKKPLLSGSSAKRIRPAVSFVKMFIAIQLFHGLHHVTNIWRGTELGFNADDPYLSSIIGKTVTQITYYTANGVYVLPVSVAL